MRDAKDDVLSFTQFPFDRWRKIWSINPIERLNQIRRSGTPSGQFQHFLHWLIKGASLITSAVTNDRGCRAVPATQRIIPRATLGPLR
jgi:hypothetical protein